MRFLRARSLAELGKVASGSATQGLWLKDSKVGSRVIDEDRSRLPGRETVREVRRGGRRASKRSKERVHRFRVKYGRERRASCLPCLSLGLGDDRRSMSGSRDVSLMTLITYASCTESLTSYTNRFFHISGPPGFRMAFDVAKRNGRFGRIQCQRSKTSSSRGKKKRREFLCRRTVRIEVRSEVIPANFLKVQRRGMFAKAKDGRKRDG